MQLPESLKRQLPATILALQTSTVVAACQLSRADTLRASTIIASYRVSNVQSLFGSSLLWAALSARAPLAANAIKKWLETYAVAPALSSPKPVYPAMPANTLDAWAAKHNVLDLLAVRAVRVPSLRSDNWAVYGGSGQDVRTVLTSKVATRDYIWDRTPPRAVSLAVAEWLIQAAALPKPAVETRPAAFPALAPLAVRLDRWLKEHGDLPTGDTAELTAHVHDPDPLIIFNSQGSITCQEANGVFRTNAEGKPSEAPITCGCSSPPPSCRARQHVARWLRARLTDPDAPEMQRLAAKVEAPAWSRTLAMLSSVAVPDEKVELGWALVTETGLEIRPLTVKHTKKGLVKTAFLAKSELPNWNADRTGVPADELLIDLAPTLVGAARRLDHILLALRALIGHPRLFWAETRSPCAVVSGRVTPHLVPDPKGVRVELRLPSGPISPQLLAQNLSSSTSVNGRFPLETPNGITLVEVGPAVLRLIEVLRYRGDSFAAEAIPELLKVFGERGLPLAVHADLPVHRVNGDVRPVLRLEAAGAHLLGVDLRVRPHPGLTALRPGEGVASLIGKSGDETVVVDRRLEEERSAATALVESVGLEPNPEWFWGIDDPEVAMRLVSTLQDGQGATVEWSSRKPTIRTAQASKLSMQIGAGSDWFGVAGGLEVGTTVVPLHELLAAMRGGRTWIRAEGDLWIRIEDRLRERLGALADATDDKGRIAKIHGGVVEALSDEGVKVEAPPAWMGAMERMREAATLKPKLPKTLKAELRPYQLDGFRWLTRLLHWAGGAVLADDMGLGKTVQALAVLLDRAVGGPQLVVAPMSVGFNWLREAERFAPSLRLHLHHGGERAEDLGHLRPGDLVVTTWDILARDAALLAPTWHTVVFDEAQAMKNAETLRARAASQLKADARIALSGTPIENRLSELWSLLNVVAPGLLGSASSFRGRFAVPIEREGNQERRQALAAMVRPFLLRRIKREVAKELPDRSEVRVDVELGPEERRLYERVRSAAVAALTTDQGPKEQLRFRVLTALTRLRQIACAAELADDSAPAGSAKLDRLMELLTELREQGRKVLVFSQFAELLKRVAPRLDAAGFRYCHLDGSTPAKERRVLVDRFQAGETDVFLLSLKAGGIGLNLTAASEVILLDPWWNPAVEDQAADRAHRIGQTEAVTIYRLVTRQTVEEAILAMHETKRDLAGAILSGTGDSGALTVDELLALLAGGSPATPAAAGTQAKKTKKP